MCLHVCYYWKQANKIVYGLSGTTYQVYNLFIVPAIDKASKTNVKHLNTLLLQNYTE